MHTIPVSFSAIGPEIILLGTAAVVLIVGIFLRDEPARRLGAAAAELIEDPRPAKRAAGDHHRVGLGLLVLRRIARRAIAP